MQPRLRSTFLAAALAAAALGTGCNGSAAREPDEYLGCASDENWKTFDDYQLTGRVTLDDALAPKLTNLSAAMSLPASPPYKIEWQISPSVPGKAGGTAACDACPSCGSIGPVHLPPVSGDVYDLQFSTEGVLRWRTITTLQAYTVAQGAWSQLLGKTVSLRITRLGLKANDVVEGPFQPAGLLEFSVGK